MILLHICERTTPSGPVTFFHVEVEQEVATVFEDGEDTFKYLFQLAQTHHVVQAVKGREDRRKPAGQSDVPGVLDDEFHVRSVLPRDLDHRFRAIQARREKALPRKLGGKLSGTAAEIQDGASGWKFPQDQIVEDRVHVRREETPMPIVDARKGVVCVVAAHYLFQRLALARQPSLRDDYGRLCGLVSRHEVPEHLPSVRQVVVERWYLVDRTCAP
ncbi:MAG: hypothetical protein OXN85_13105 [Gemmatimonadetes bacterium]|nr:hypothetical protein [Candidatus Palauibacter australiensis]